MRPLVWLALLFGTGALLLAQEHPATNPAANNPHLGNPESIRGGMTLYRVRCGECLIIAYLRKIGTVAAPANPIGNVENGGRLFASQCVSCHSVAGRGGRLGPDLSRIGASRSHSALVREIRTPSEWVPPSYETVTLVTKDGERIRGTKKNEDVFSIQIMDLRERIQGYLKSNLQQVIYEQGSLMPAFDSARLNDSDLTDLIAYLSTLRSRP